MNENLYSLSNLEVEALIKDNFSSNLTKLLRDNGISKSKLCSDLHFSSKQLWSYESGISIPSLATILKIANYLDTNIEMLVCITPDPIKDNDDTNFQSDVTQKLLEIQKILERLVNENEKN